MQKLFILTFVILFSACGSFAETDIKDRIEYLKKRIEYAEDDIKEWKKELKSLQSSGVFSKYTSKRGKIKDKREDISIDLNAVLMVNNSNGAATAFLGKIDGKTYIISNLHVLGEMKNAKITTIDGKEVRLPKTCFLQKGFDVFLAELDDVPEGVSPLEISKNVMTDTNLKDDLVVSGNSQGGNVMRNIEGTLLAVGPKLLETDCNFYKGNSGSPVIHKDSGKVVGVVSYIMTIDDDLSTRITRKSKAKNFNMRFFAYRLDTMDDKTEIPYETVVETMDELNKAEKKLEMIIDFLVNNNHPPASEYPELARVAKSYETATDNAYRVSSNWSAKKRMNEAKRMLLSRIELLAAAEIMKLKSGKYDDVFSEKYDGILKGYENVKNYCNKKAKDFI